MKTVFDELASSYVISGNFVRRIATTEDGEKNENYVYFPDIHRLKIAANVSLLHAVAGKKAELSPPKIKLNKTVDFCYFFLAKDQPFCLGISYLSTTGSPAIACSKC